MVSSLELATRLLIVVSFFQSIRSMVKHLVRVTDLMRSFSFSDIPCD